MRSSPPITSSIALALVCSALVGRPAGGQGAAQPATQMGAPVAFVDVTVLPMDSERTLEHQTVLVRGDRIVSVEPAARARLPRDVVRIDGRGKFLMPGLAEMHGHIPGQNTAFAEATSLLFVANGVTIVRGMLGNPAQFTLRESIRSGRVIGPTLHLASPPMSGLGPNGITSPAAGAARVREHKQAGYDLLKIHEGLSRATYDSIAAAARQVGLTFGGHVPDSVGIWHALEMRQATVDHLDNYVDALQAAAFPGGVAADAMDARLAAIARATREANVAVVPTSALWATFLAPEDSAGLGGRLGLRYMPRQMVGTWYNQVGQFRQQTHPDSGRMEVALRGRLLKAMQDAGVRILLGTDAPQLFSVPGFSIHREIQMMREAGLTPYQILRSGTVAPAEYFGQTAEFGTVAAGRRADLILLDANPLADVANLQRRAGVMLRGRWLPESELQQRLEALAAQNAN
jgi:imidazolonepropionase-like amidohydrolase